MQRAVYLQHHGKQVVGSTMERDGKRLFYVAPFVVDGEFLGVGEWNLNDLSPRWLKICQDLLRYHEEIFSTSLPAPLDNITLRFTSSPGVALATLFQGEIPSASSLFLTGSSPATEQQLLTMFVQSARRLHVVQASQKTSEPFAEVFGITERPLHAVIPFGNTDKGTMIAEFSTHLAGAFLLAESA